MVFNPGFFGVERFGAFCLCTCDGVQFTDVYFFNMFHCLIVVFSLTFVEVI